VSRAITTQTRRELRRIIGPEMAEIVGQHNIAILAMSSLLIPVPSSIGADCAR
jgi:hypothetical protein